MRLWIVAVCFAADTICARAAVPAAIDDPLVQKCSAFTAAAISYSGDPVIKSAGKEGDVVNGYVWMEFSVGDNDHRGQCWFAKSTIAIIKIDGTTVLDSRKAEE